MDQPGQKPFGLNDAVRIAEGYRDIDATLTQAEEFLLGQLQDASDRDYEKKAQMYYYLLQLLLKKNLNFETPMAEKYYANMHEQFQLAVADMEKQMKENKDNRQVAMFASQLKAFYKLIEKFYGSLYREYAQKSFGEAKERAYVHRMQYRMARYWLEKKYPKAISLLIFEKVSSFGTSYGRWLAVAGAIVVFGGLLLAVHDVIFTPKVLTSSTVLGLDYLLLSTSLMTLSGPMMIIGVQTTFAAKFLMALLAALGFGMLAALVHLLIKRM